MIRSMTGYGEAEVETSVGRLRLEVKSVNHRFFNTSVRTPPGFDRYEQGLVAALKEHGLSRGHLNVSLSLDPGTTAEGSAAPVDLERARAYKNALEAVQAEFALPGVVDLGMIARFSDVFRKPEPDPAALELEEGTLRDLAGQAVERVIRMRRDEGGRLQRDMVRGLDAMSSELDAVADRAPGRLESERDRLRTAVAELTDQVEVDEDRLAREIAYLAEKWDINEELVRFRAHIEAFRETLDGDDAEPAGKRLGFLVQEMHREANTIGSKSNDAAIAQSAVALKEEVERLREQVENVE